MADGSKHEQDMEELRGLIIDLQAEISALKNLMIENNPALAKELQRRVDDIRKDMKAARREKIQ